MLIPRTLCIIEKSQDEVKTSSITVKGHEQYLVVSFTIPQSQTGCKKTLTLSCRSTARNNHVSMCRRADIGVARPLPRLEHISQPSGQ
jgi:hypothetical protein